VWVRIVRAGRGRLRGERDFWCTATIKGRLFFNPPDAPLQVWAVSIQPAGVIWAEAEVRKIAAAMAAHIAVREPSIEPVGNFPNRSGPKRDRACA
jgi:hypothetical protein